MKLNNKEFPYSFSQNRLYNDCPRKYKYRYVDGIKEPTNENLELGSAVHKLFELYYKNITDLEIYTTDEYVERTEAINTIKKLKGTIYAEKLLDEFSALTQSKQEYNIAREFAINMEDFTAIIDLVHNYTEQSHKYTLVDYKVTKKPKTDSSIYDEGQLLIYKYMWCMHNPEIKASDVAVQYVNILPYLSDKIITVTEPQVPSFETCEAVYQTAMKTKEKILAGEFPKKKKWCRWCYYKDICDKDNT